LWRVRSDSAPLLRHAKTQQTSLAWISNGRTRDFAREKEFAKSNQTKKHHQRKKQ
jgi:hypothetical protein